MNAEVAKAASKDQPAHVAPRYSFGFAWLHWATAFLVVAAYVVTEARAALIETWPEFLRSAHVQVGLVFFFFMMVRLAVIPWAGSPGPASNPRFLDRFAYGIHGLLYVLMIIVPLSGIASSLLQAQDVSLLGLVTLPAPASEEIRWLATPARRLHELSAHALIMVALLHTLAALFHHFVLRDRLISRMSLW